MLQNSGKELCNFYLKMLRKIRKPQLTKTSAHLMSRVGSVRWNKVSSTFFIFKTDLFHVFLNDLLFFILKRHFSSYNLSFENQFVKIRKLRKKKTDLLKLEELLILIRENQIC